MDNMEEMNQFLEKHYHPKLNQEEIEDMNRQISSTKTEMVIKNLPTEEARWASQVNYTKTSEKS